jgi:hypothetical protein
VTIIPAFLVVVSALVWASLFAVVVARIAFLHWSDHHICPVYAEPARLAPEVNRAAGDAAVGRRDWADTDQQVLPRQRFQPASHRAKH